MIKREDENKELYIDLNKLLLKELKDETIKNYRVNKYGRTELVEEENIKKLNSIKKN